MRSALPVERDVVLAGGGHAHVHVLTAFAMRPEPGVRLTLVTRDLATPYSGMLPGVVAGLYTRDEAHIDLVRLTAATAVRLIHADVVGLDRPNKRLLLAGRPPLAYDIVSFDVGIVPALGHIEGAAQHAIAVKPIGSFLRKFDALVARCRSQDGPRTIAVIGGGAGGVELLLSMRARLIREVQAAGQDAAALSFLLVTDGEILATHNAHVRDAFRRIFAERGIALHERRRVRAVNAGAIELDDGEQLPADAILVTTDAAPPPWFRDTGLALDGGGFLSVTPALQARNDPDVFAAGDCAALATPREKAGVYAVRAGPPLANNLRRRVRGEALKPWVPQRRHLALISTGERYAVASRGALKAEGAWLWTVKDWIDRRWMRKYQDVDAIVARMAEDSARRNRAERSDPEAMRCGGCAAKIGAGPLSRALARLAPAPSAPGLIVGLADPDDAAVFSAPAGKELVQTVDFFRAFIDDPYVFAEIAANHALNDVFAMGGVPRFAVATAAVPPGTPAKVEEELFQLLAGARACLDRENVALIGGHSSEGAELALGLTVTGEVGRSEIIRKSGLQTGDALILTRALGTGILFAGAMRARAEAGWIEVAVEDMRRSNRDAARIVAAHGVTAMTDVTGYGLIGHLAEMLAASRVCARLALTDIPVYEGASILASQGVVSTLLPENLKLSEVLEGSVAPAMQAIIFDPQTSGGMLAGIPSAQAADCLRDLQAAGYHASAVIGQVEEVVPAAREIRIRIR